MDRIKRYKIKFGYERGNKHGKGKGTAGNKETGDTNASFENIQNV